MRDAAVTIACLLCVALFVVRGERALTRQSQTFDEAVHLTAGYSYWRTGDFRINRETPPLMKLIWALPLLLIDRPPFEPDAQQWDKNDIWRMSDAFLYDSPVSHTAMLHSARRVNLAFGAAVVVLVGWWAYRWLGLPSGIAAWFVAALDPNLLGQSIVLSTDVGLTLFALGAAYALWEYAQSTRRGWFVLSGICFGLALATKFSALVAVAGTGLGALVFVWRGKSLALPGAAIATDRRQRLTHLFAFAVRLGLIAALVVAISYFFIRALEWPAGLRQQLGRNENKLQPYFLHGEISTSGWFHYFLVVLWLKTPTITLILALVGAVRKWDWPRRDVAFLIIPAFVFFVAMSLAKLDFGLRVVLPAYPLLWLLAARAVAFNKSHRTSGVVLSVFVALVGGFAWMERDRANMPISYFSQRFEQSHHWLGDSNLDWGQGLIRLHEELAAHGQPTIYLSYAGTARPEAYGIKYERLPGWPEFRPKPLDRIDSHGRILLAISVTNLQGTYLADPTLYHWLRERTPISRLDGSIWLFDLTDDADARGRLRILAAD